MAESRVLPEVEAKPRFFYGYIVVGLCFLGMLIMWGLTYTYGVFFKPVSQEFGWSRAVTSGAFSLFSFLHGMLYIVTGKLNDRFGPRALTTVCGLFLGLGFLLMSFTASLWQLYFFYGVLMAIGLSGSTVPMFSTVARWFVKRRGLATAIAASGVGVGIIITPPLATWLISAYGWRFSYLYVGIAALVSLTLLAQFLKRDPSQVGQLPYGIANDGRKGTAEWQPEGFSLNEALSSRRFWILCSIFFCFASLTGLLLVHLVPYVTDLGISPEIAASIVAVIGGTSIIGRLVIGPLADRIGMKSSLLIVCVLKVATFLWLLQAREVGSFYLFAVICGFSWGGGNVLLSPVTAEAFGLKSHGVILGVVGAVSTVGSAISPLLAGYIYDTFGSYTIAFVFLAGLSGVALLLGLFLKFAPKKLVAG
ncbi:MAG: MFS transporter [Chloroflexi bacterium]|nr:MFS transporter [Chloroflexota bacterium]